MTIEELYAQVGGNYDDALARLCADDLIEVVLGVFLEDTTCPDVVEAWGRGDDAAAFDAAHAAKGMCMNLAFTKLGVLASDITEALRPGNEGLRASTDVNALVCELEAEYAKVCGSVQEYLAQK